MPSTKNEQQSDWMDLAELADRLGIHRQTAYEFAWEGKLPVPAIKVGNRYRVSRRAYERLLEGEQAPEKE